jgi:hypothetical protein
VPKAFWIQLVSRLATVWWKGCWLVLVVTFEILMRSVMMLVLV